MRFPYIFPQHKTCIARKQYMYLKLSVKFQSGVKAAVVVAENSDNFMQILELQKR